MREYLLQILEGDGELTLQAIALRLAVSTVIAAFLLR